MSATEQLDSGLSAMGLALPEDARQKLMAYLALLAKWNKTFSLTALRNPDKGVA